MDNKEFIEVLKAKVEVFTQEQKAVKQAFKESRDMTLYSKYLRIDRAISALENAIREIEKIEQ